MDALLGGDEVNISISQIIQGVIISSIIGISGFMLSINNTVIRNEVTLEELEEKVDKPVYTADSEVTNHRFDSKKEDIDDLKAMIIKLELKIEDLQDEMHNR